MDKTQATFLVVTLLSTATFAMDGSSGHGSMMDMKAMDTDKNGMLSEEEYMKGHEGMSDRETQWTGMKKNASDMVDMDEMEIPHHCAHSIIEIRRILSDEIGKLDTSSALSQSLRALRAACRKFLDTVQSEERILEFGAHQGHFASWTFNGAVGELRGCFGIHLAQIAAQYGLDIEDKLATILPAPDVKA